MNKVIQRDIAFKAVGDRQLSDTLDLSTKTLTLPATITANLVSSNATSQSLTDGAIALTGGGGAILLDDAGHKRLSWNDAGGSLNLRGGNYHNGTAVVYAKGVSDANGGAATIALRSDGQDGSVTMSVAAVGTPGTAVTYNNTLTLAPASLVTAGSFGVGNITPATSLHVETSAPAIRQRNSASAAGLFRTINVDTSNQYVITNQSSQGVFLTAAGTAWTSLSDERLKDDLVPITSAAEKVSRLRAVTGRYKNDDTETRRSFLIAQDVQAVLPEAVTEQDDEIKSLGLAYTDVIPLLVAAIKELKSIVEAQASDIADLRSNPLT